MLHLSFHATITHSHLLTGTKLNLLSGEAECLKTTRGQKKQKDLKAQIFWKVLDKQELIIWYFHLLPMKLLNQCSHVVILEFTKHNTHVPHIELTNHNERDH